MRGPVQHGDRAGLYVDQRHQTTGPTASCIDSKIRMDMMAWQEEAFL